jgi:ATP-dependent DNA helicase DinG
VSAKGLRLLPLFPIEAEPYPQQKAALSALKKWLLGDKKFALMRAPTGIGKSAIAITMGRASAQLGSGCFILTAKKFLQEQYITEYPEVGLANLWGKSNYPCTLAASEGLTRNCGQCILAKAKDTRGRRGKMAWCSKNCPYILAKNAAIGSKLSLANFESFLYNQEYANECFGTRKLLIVDEAHLLPDRLSSFASMEIRVFYEDIGEAINNAPKNTTAVSLANWISTDLKPAIQSQLDDLESVMKEAEVEDIPEMEGVTFVSDLMKEAMSEPKDELARLTRVQENLTRAERYIDSNPANWAVDIGVDKKAELIVLHLRPITLAAAGEMYLYRHFDKVLLISATMDTGPYVKDIGVAPADIGTFIEVPSVFKLPTRPLLFTPVGSMSRKNVDATLPKAAKALDDILRRHHGERGIIHTRSFALAKNLRDAMSDYGRSRCLFHTDNSVNIQGWVARLKKSPGKWLVSPSCTEGLDGKGDLVRGQVILKVSYPYLGDSRVAGRKAMPDGDMWYTMQAIYDFMQAYGRGTRSKTDYSVTYVLDSSANSLIRRGTKYLPKWFVETWNKSNVRNWVFVKGRWILRT